MKSELTPNSVLYPLKRLTEFDCNDSLAADLKYAPIDLFKLSNDIRQIVSLTLFQSVNFSTSLLQILTLEGQIISSQEDF